MRQTTISGHHETRYPIAETLWILAGIVLIFAFGDALTLLVLALAIVTMTTAWWIHRRVEHRVDRNEAELASFRVGSKGYTMAVIWLLMLAAGALGAALTLAAPAQAAAIDSRFDICAALRNGTSLATIETTLEARGYSATNAGALTGITIRQQCPDQAAGVLAQIS
jgi:Flp pilus assembly protein TadB